MPNGFHLTAIVISSLLASAASAELSVYAYPKGGQSAAQQAKDDADCQQWAQSKTGFDPNSSPPQVVANSTAPVAPTAGPLRGAAGGAALGAIGGAIAGDAGKGAAIGAASGAALGTMRRANQHAQAQQIQAQQQAQLAQQQQSINQQFEQARSNFSRAYGSCMSARQYEIR